MLYLKIRHFRWKILIFYGGVFLYAFFCKMPVKTQIIDEQNYRFNALYLISENAYKISFYKHFPKFLFIDTCSCYLFKRARKIEKTGKNICRHSKIIELKLYEHLCLLFLRDL